MSPFLHLSQSAMLRFTLLALLIGMAFAASVNAATFVVNTTADTQDAAPGNGTCADANELYDTDQNSNKYSYSIHANKILQRPRQQERREG